MTDDMLSILERANLRSKVMESITRSIEENVGARHFSGLRTAVIIFSKEFGVLGMTSGANHILDLIRKEY